MAPKYPISSPSSQSGATAGIVDYMTYGESNGLRLDKWSHFDAKVLKNSHQSKSRNIRTLGKSYKHPKSSTETP
jgi:hypothetical protein